MSTTTDLQTALGRLLLSILNQEAVGVQMSALSDVLQALKARVNEDFAEQRRLLDEALANDAADDAELARVTARADELQADIDAAISDAGTVDPDAAFPAAGGVVTPPVDPAPPVDPNAPPVEVTPDN